MFLYKNSLNEHTHIFIKAKEFKKALHNSNDPLNGVKQVCLSLPAAHQGEEDGADGQERLAHARPETDSYLRAAVIKEICASVLKQSAPRAHFLLYLTLSESHAPNAPKSLCIINRLVLP